MVSEGQRLGIDFGTSSTVAVLSGPDGRDRQLLFGETPVMPSAVYLDPDGVLLVGADALRSSRARPEHFEPNPKARIDDGILLLGDEEIPIVDVIAAVLRRVHDEAVRVGGGPVGSTVLTHPAVWGIHRRGILQRAAALAGLHDVSLVAEPVAAAAYFVKILGNAVPVDSSIVIYDLGAGTFDASVVRRTPEGYTVLAEQGLSDAGGLDLDAAVFAYLGTVHAGAAWDRLAHPRTTPDRRASRLLWDDIRNGKEALSRAANTTIFIPLLDTDAVLGREQLEQLAGPLLARTVAATEAAIHAAGVTPSAVLLVGGASRMPVVATLLHRALGFPPTAIEQPQLVVAGGSLRVPESQHGTVLLSAQPDDQLSASGFPVSAPPGANWPVSASPVSPAAFPSSGFSGSGEPGAWPPPSDPPATDDFSRVPAEPPPPPDVTDASWPAPGIPTDHSEPVSGVPVEPPPGDPVSGGASSGDPAEGSGTVGAAHPVGPEASPGPALVSPHAAASVSPAPAASVSPAPAASVSPAPPALVPQDGAAPVSPAAVAPVSPAAVGRVSMGVQPPSPPSIRRPIPGADDSPPALGRRRFLQVAGAAAGVAAIGGFVYAAKALGDSGGGNDPGGGDNTTDDDTTSDDGSTPDDSSSTGDGSTPDSGETTADHDTPNPTDT